VFDSIGWAEILIIVVAGLFILGPERLPAAAAWLGRNVRKVREFASGARQQLKDEMGDDYEELRKPLQELQNLRGMDPRRAMTKHLFEDIDVNQATKPNGHTPPPPVPVKPEESKPTPGEKAPFDPDAT
jgi:sec-independent protein translocase protein TatB